MQPVENSSALRFCANLKWLFTELEFTRRFAAAAQAGFKAVEYASPYGYAAAELKKCLADNGLQQILINTPPGTPGTLNASGVACQPDKKAVFREDMEKALYYAHELNCSMIHLQSGIHNSDYSRREAFDTLVENVVWAADLARQAQVTLIFEAINQRDIPGFFLQTQAQALSVVQAVDADNVGLLFDIYHCQVSEGDITTHLKEFMPAIRHVQVADVPTRSEPGTGEIAWPFIFRQLLALGYKGWVGCEYRPAGGTLEGLGWLTALTDSRARIPWAG